MEMAGLPPFLSGSHACTSPRHGFLNPRWICTYVHVQTACTCARRRDERPARDTDGRFKGKAVGKINFFIYYHLDDDTSKHVVQLENYTSTPRSG